jgi:hypothetical protein
MVTIRYKNDNYNQSNEYKLKKKIVEKLETKVTEKTWKQTNFKNWETPVNDIRNVMAGIFRLVPEEENK